MLRGPVSLAAGILVLAAAWLGFAPWAPEAFWAHMSMHMAVVAIAAPLLAIQAAGRWWDAAARWPRAVSPIPMSLVEFVVVWTWHAPGPHHFARHSLWGLVMEQGTFLASGWLVWISALGGTAEQRHLRAASGVIGLLLTSMHMTLLGALLALAPRPLYSHSMREGHLDPLTDQQLGGAVMLLVGGVSYLTGGIWLTARWVLRERLAVEKVRS